MVVAGDYNRSGECGGDPGVSTTPGITEGIRVIDIAWAFLNPRHERLTVLAPTWPTSGAFSQAGEGVLFCPTRWTAAAPHERERFLTMG